MSILSEIIEIVKILPLKITKDRVIILLVILLVISLALNLSFESRINTLKEVHKGKSNVDETRIATLKEIHQGEIREYESRIKTLKENHQREIKGYESRINTLKEDHGATVEDYKNQLRDMDHEKFQYLQYVQGVIIQIDNSEKREMLLFEFSRLVANSMR